MFWCTKSVKFHFRWGTKPRDQKQETGNKCDVISGLQASRKTDYFLLNNWLGIFKNYSITALKTSQVDMVLIHSAVKMTQRSSIHTALAVLRAACNYSFAFMSRFSQYVTFLTEPDHTTYRNLDFHYQMMDTFSSALAKFHVLSWFILVTTYSARP